MPDRDIFLPIITSLSLKIWLLLIQFSVLCLRKTHCTLIQPPSTGFLLVKRLFRHYLSFRNHFPGHCSHLLPSQILRTSFVFLAQRHIAIFSKKNLQEHRSCPYPQSVKSNLIFERKFLFNQLSHLWIFFFYQISIFFSKDYYSTTPVPRDYYFSDWVAESISPSVE